MIERYLDTEELKRLLSVLIVVGGCLILAALFGSLIIPGLRNANRPEKPTAVEPVVGESGWLNPEEFPPQRGGVIPPVDPKTLMEPSASLLERGKALFEGNCTQCHGLTGKGDGPAARTMIPRPRDLSVPAEWKNGYHLPGIYKTLTEGIEGTSMAAFDYLSRKDRMALVHYVQSLGDFDHGAGDPQAREALAKELGSAGEIVPNKIPISMAMAKLEQEYIAAPRLPMEPSGQSTGAEILRQVIRDADRAGRFLALSSSWKSSYQALSMNVLANAPGNGFSLGVAMLSAAEWQELHKELLRRVESK